MKTIILSLISLCCLDIFVSANYITPCQPGRGVIYKKQVSDLGSSAYRTIDNVRSVVECLTYCYPDDNCATAVYQKTGRCHILHANIASSLQDDADGDSVVEVRFIPTCNPPCPDNSICMKDCADMSNPVAACVDASLSACKSAGILNLTEEWRKDNSGSKIQPGGSYNCDRDIFYSGIWFRIVGDAGIAIRNACPPAYSCGTHAGAWTNASMPTIVGEMRQVPLYGSWNGNCNWLGNYLDFPNPLTVQKCSPADGDLVYKIDGKGACSASVCTMD